MQRLIIFSLLVLMVAASGLLYAEEAEQESTTLQLSAEYIDFDPQKGEISLDKNVRVVRELGEETLTITCDKLNGKLQDGELSDVEAIGNVKLDTGQLSATGTRAVFDFEENIIRLYGTEDEWATASSEGVNSRGPEIIFNIETQKVTLPEGGVTDIDTSRRPGTQGD